MLVVANGAYKSGSTWQRNIIRELINFSELPEKYRGKGRFNAFLNYGNFDEFLASDDIRFNHYLAKAHLFNKDQVKLFTANPEYVKVFMIERDLRDAIVSHYNHFINVRRIKPSFKAYYWTIGRLKAIEIINYNENWKGDFDNVHYSTFEALKKNTAGEIRKFTAFLKVSVTDEKLEEIINKTSLKRMREKSDRKWFFRKGQIGDYKNYMTTAIERDLEQLKTQRGIMDRVSFKMFNAVRSFS